MTDRLLDRTRGGDEHAFSELTEPYRRELQFHCYRMLGSVQDAEDMLQETLLAAWRGPPRLRRALVASRLAYRIATNRCLTAASDWQVSCPRAPTPSRHSRPTSKTGRHRLRTPAA